MGKSALLAKIRHDVLSRDPNAFILRVHGAELASLCDLTSADPLTLVARWQQAVCKLLSLELARRIRFARTDTEMTLVEAAELANYKGRNLVGALLERLKIKAAPIEIEHPEAANPHNLLRAHAANGGSVNAWLLIDDIDETFLNTPEARLRTSTFFSAVRKLIADFKGLMVRVSVRTDVWTSLARSNEAMDKCEQYAHDLTWSSRESRIIQSKKILAYVQRNYPTSFVGHWDAEKNATALLGLAFPSVYRWNDAAITPERLIHRLSAGRPRWSDQLCRLAGEVAHSKRAKRILVSHIEAVLEHFGKLRLDDLHREHRHQFEGIQGLTEAFSGGKHIYYTKDLLTALWDRFVVRQGGTAMIPPLDGRPVQAPLDLAHFLFRIGFISARGRDPKQKITYVTYDERPDLLANLVNPDDGMKWDVHPSYRKHLRIVRGEDA